MNDPRALQDGVLTPDAPKTKEVMAATPRKVHFDASARMVTFEIMLPLMVEPVFVALNWMSLKAIHVQILQNEIQDEQRNAQGPRRLVTPP